MQDEGVEMKLFLGSILYHIDDLPFELDQMPLNYGGFTECVRGLSVRKTIKALDQIKGLPSRGDVDPGEIPSLMELGLNPPLVQLPSRNAHRKKASREWLKELNLQNKNHTSSCVPAKAIQMTSSDHSTVDLDAVMENEIIPIVVRPGHIRFETAGDSIHKENSKLTYS